jgi:hypothetical protein
MRKSPFLGDCEKCLGTDRNKALGARNHGRPRTSEADRKLFEIAVKNYHLGNAKASLATAWRAMLRNAYLESTEKDGKRLFPEDSYRLPTYRAFCYWYRGRFQKLMRETTGTRRFTRAAQEVSHDIHSK